MVGSALSCEAGDVISIPSVIEYGPESTRLNSQASFLTTRPWGRRWMRPLTAISHFAKGWALLHQLNVLVQVDISLLTELYPNMMEVHKAAY